LFTGGLRIYTNEVPGLQAYAQKVSASDIPSSLPGVVSALTVMDPRTGNVEAVVGGPDGTTAQFDDATQGERQPGSGFKLFTLIGALESGYNVNDSILAESPCAIQFPGVPYQFGYNLAHPMNNDPGDPNGPVSLVEATAMSINCAYLRLAHEVGLSKVVAVARDMGVSDPTLNPSNPSLVIGSEAVRPIEMTAAYATVADGGVYHAPVFVNHIVDRSGTVVYNGEGKGRRVFSAQIAAEALVALRATVQWGTGTAAALPNAEVAGKTGTTEHSVDAWFNGITPNLACSVWMGDPRGEVPMYIGGAEVFGASYPTQIWHDVAAYALSGSHYFQFPTPDYAGLPPVEYINSAALQRDDLIAHGWPPAAPTTTTRPSKHGSKLKPGSNAANATQGATAGSGASTGNAPVMPKNPPGPPQTAPPQQAMLPASPAPGALPRSHPHG
ncbi:MAG TPA: transglycosylase domain-containing protein, partial [Acidimicrobiales bacterium]|nr:transglycosylase domain-containing protein [Acidimicrobiales bacterium]